MTSSWRGDGPSATQSVSSLAADNKVKRANARQKLSCTKCRERKVKCDRTDPCSACCSRGHPKECQFETDDANDYVHIQQSYEIRKLRHENQELKKKLQYAQRAWSGDEDDGDGRTDRRGSTSTARAAATRQRRFKINGRTDNLYFGTPSVANIVSDFANIQLGAQSLTHAMPRGKDLYAIEDTPSYPFHIFENHSSIDSLVEILPARKELFEFLNLFQCRAQACTFPQTPHEQPLRTQDIKLFLDNSHQNAQNSPDTLALLFAMLATGVQMGQYDTSGGEWVEGAVEASRIQRSDPYIGASMQALRHASFMSRPTLAAIQTLVMLGPYLVNSGRFLDAWALFGITVRLAHSVGLHRKPQFLDPTPDVRECTIRQTLWWWILHMDQQYSVTLGRPLGISGIGDCPPPKPLTTNATMLRLGEFVDRFTILARQILSSNEMVNLAAVDGFTDKLIALWDTMPAALQFTVNWIQPTAQLPEWPLDVMSVNLFVKVQSFIILLNRQRQEKTQNSSSHTWPGWNASSERPPSSRAPVRGRPLVIQSSVSILHAFMFFYQRQKAVLICWTMGQQAFNACMILILDAWETGNFHNEFTISQAYVVFCELDNKGVHKLAGLAVKRISEGLVLLEQRRTQQYQSQTQTSFPSQPFHHAELELDTASMPTDAVMGKNGIFTDTVMGNTSMHLLEDKGYQFYSQPTTSAFQTAEWIMPSSARPSEPSRFPTPDVQSPAIPISDITAMPFPVLSPPTIPVTSPPHAIGLQPRLLPARGRTTLSSSQSQSRQSYSSHDNMPEIDMVDVSRQAFAQQHSANDSHSSSWCNSIQNSGVESRGVLQGTNGSHPSSRTNSVAISRGVLQSHNGQRLEKVGKSHRRR